MKGEAVGSSLSCRSTSAHLYHLRCCSVVVGQKGSLLPRRPSPSNSGVKPAAANQQANEGSKTSKVININKMLK